MASLLSNFAKNHAKGIHKIKSPQRVDNKNEKRMELNTKIVSAVLNKLVLTRKSLMKT